MALDFLFSFFSCPGMLWIVGLVACADGSQSWLHSQRHYSSAAIPEDNVPMIVA